MSKAKKIVVFTDGSEKDVERCEGRFLVCSDGSRWRQGNPAIAEIKAKKETRGAAKTSPVEEEKAEQDAKDTNKDKNAAEGASDAPAGSKE